MDVCVRACMRVSVCMCVRVCVCVGGSGVDFSKFDQEGGSDFPHKKGGIGKIGCRFKNWGGGGGGGGGYHLFWAKILSLFSQN